MKVLGKTGFVRDGGSCLIKVDGVGYGGVVRTMQGLNDGAFQPEQTPPMYAMRMCLKCDYPMERSSRDAEGCLICPECGEVLGPQVLDSEQLDEIRTTYIGTKYSLARFLGLSLAVIVLSNGFGEAGWSGRGRSDLILDGIFVGVPLLVLLCAHGLIGFQLKSKHGRIARLHLVWALVAFAFVLSFAQISYVSAGVLQYVFVIALISALVVLAWDMRDRAGRFPIVDEARLPKELATRALQIAIGLGVLVIVCTALLHPMMETAWTFVGIMIYVLGLLMFSLLMGAQVGLHQAARRWMHPIELDDSSV